MLVQCVNRKLFSRIAVLSASIFLNHEDFEAAVTCGSIERVLAICSEACRLNSNVTRLEEKWNKAGDHKTAETGLMRT